MAVQMLSNAWELGSVAVAPEEFRMNGAVARQDLSHGASVAMCDHIKQLRKLPLSRFRRKQLNEQPSSLEQKAYQSITGQLNRLGTCVSLFSAFAASCLQHREIDTVVNDLIVCNNMVHSLHKRQPMLKRLPVGNFDCYIMAFTDAKSVHSALHSDRSLANKDIVSEIEQLRKGYLSEGFHDLAWIKGTENPVDPLTKESAPMTSLLLEELLATGRLPIDVENLEDEQLFEEE